MTAYASMPSELVVCIAVAAADLLKRGSSFSA